MGPSCRVIVHAVGVPHLGRPEPAAAVCSHLRAHPFTRLAHLARSRQQRPPAHSPCSSCAQQTTTPTHSLALLILRAADNNAHPLTRLAHLACSRKERPPMPAISKNPPAPPPPAPRRRAGARPSAAVRTLTAAAGILHGDCRCKATAAVGILHRDCSCRPRLTCSDANVPKSAATFGAYSCSISIQLQ